MEEIAKYIWSFNKSIELVGEPHELSEARYIDTLHEDKEQLWQDFVITLRETKQSSIDTFIDLWKNDTAPTVFKDRALLSIIGTSAVRGVLNVGNMAAFGGYFTKSPTSVLQDLEHPYTQRLSHWYDEARTYTAEHEVDLVDDSSLLHWAKFRFDRGEINEDGLNNLLNTIDIAKASPKYYEDSDHHLSPNRFPLLDDLLVDKSEKLRDWAATMLDLWIQKQSDPSVEIPEWLNNVTIQQASEYIIDRALPHAIKSSEYIDKIWPVIQKLDLEWVFPSRMHTFQEMIRVTQNQDTRDQLLIQVFQLSEDRFKTYLNRQRFIDELKEFVAQSNNEVVAALFEEKLPYILDLEQNYVAAQLKRKIESDELSQKYTQQAEARQAAKHRFEGILNKLIQATD